MDIFKGFFKTKDKFLTSVLISLTFLLFISGLSSIFLRQPATWYDEEIHYVRSIQIANGDILKTQKQDNTKYGGNISQTQNKFITRAFNSKLFDKEIEAIEPNWMEDYDSITSNDKSIYKVSVTAVSYMPFQYFPFSFIVLINKILHLNVTTEFILMRLSGFLVSFVLLILAIRIIPFGKLTLILIALCPPFFLSMSSVTADSFVFGITSLFLAYSLSLIYKAIQRTDKITKNEIITYSFISLGLVFAKPPAFLLVALMIPLIIVGLHNKVLTKKQSLYFLSLILFLAFITLLWLFIVRNVDSSHYFGVAADISKQVAFLKSNPKTVLILLVKEISNYNFFGMQLGYADSANYMQLPMLSSFFIVISLTLSTFISDKVIEYGDTWNKKFVLFFNLYKIIGFIVIVGITFLLLYLQFTPVAAPQIDGVQPRYFLPYWLLLLSIAPQKINTNKKTISFIVLSGLVPLIYYFIFLYIQI
ncbi:DUF2142 domain-containing protein [Streptococcus zalophi]|uniref:DUF2142 domain-containing protein n=1 Tax=Streptococcus zalophi TaxID=640031 RepID=A0A934P8S0_9STRE|nr:DUF2142 domain-containing protein [Streptococcus zalophi]MBJ8349043.1 DUF2142 domain-containing protein [Streptococcus zalophi]MCR8967806.1 DUF2142 domain-containing protein [Streptococcus zalophi]